MSLFTESDLRFDFPADWVVRKFDDTAAYQSVSGHGLKGVDFICLAGEHDLCLIEVKNYLPRANYPTKQRTVAELVRHIERKFADSLRLIHVVHQAMQRRWTVRLRLRWYGFHLRPRPRDTYWFWWEAAQRVRNGQVRQVLWLEHVDGAYRRRVVDRLGGSVLVVDRGTNDLPLRVSLP